MKGKHSLFIFLIFFAAATSCGTLKKNKALQEDALSENQLLEKFIETTEFDMISGTPVDNTTVISRGKFWMVPKGAKVSKDSIYNRFESIAGALVTYWEYTSEEMKWDIYHQAWGTPWPFPITANGLSLCVSPISSVKLRIENAYVIDSDSIGHYSLEALSDCGIMENEEDKFIINFPKNPAAHERMCLLELYYADKSIYEEIRSTPWELMFQSEEREWPVTELLFLQMGDSVYYYPERILNEKGGHYRWLLHNRLRSAVSVAQDFSPSE